LVTACRYNMSERDRIYAKAQAAVDIFRFDEKVASVFPDMINRSVPGYGQLISLTGSLAAMYATADSRVYDLGCSTGATALAMREYIKDSSVTVVAVDDSEAMVQRCRENLSQQSSVVGYEVTQQDILEVAIEDASLVVMNFVLQFITPEQRLELLRRIYEGLKPGGVLLIAEKIYDSEEREQRQNIAWLEQFKRHNGYSELEIAQKRKALEHSLIADTEAMHRERLQQAGFSYVQQWFQAFNFRAFAAFTA
jgi:tRNA (cmo5U34)-methyltransferase